MPSLGCHHSVTTASPQHVAFPGTLSLGFFTSFWGGIRGRARGTENSESPLSSPAALTHEGLGARGVAGAQSPLVPAWPCPGGINRGIDGSGGAVTSRAAVTHAGVVPCCCNVPAAAQLCSRPGCVGSSASLCVSLALGTASPGLIPLFPGFGS